MRRWDAADRVWVLEGGFVGGVVGFRGTEYCWLGAMEVASDPLGDPASSRMVTFDCEADMVERLDRLGSFFSSVEDLDLDLCVDERGEGSRSSFSLELLDLVGVSVREVLLVLDLVLSSRFDFRLEEDLLTSARILILGLFFVFSVSSSTTLPFRDSWSRPVSGGLGGAWCSRVVFSLRSVKSVASGVGGSPFRTFSLLCALEKLG